MTVGYGSSAPFMDSGGPFGYIIDEGYFPPGAVKITRL
jgi:hypothetical protein